MKIIGYTGSGYVVDVGKEELAKLCGFAWSGDRAFIDRMKEQGAWADNEPQRIKLGVELPISGMWEKLYMLRHKSDAAAALRKLADLMEGTLAITILADPDKAG